MTITADVEGVDPITGAPVPIAVTGYQGGITPDQVVLSVSGGADGLVIESASLAGLFPIEFIDYLREDEIVRAPDWDRLPESAEEVIDFRPSREQTRSFRLDVIADLADGDQVYTSYLIEIHQDWTAGRDRLRSAIDARRN